MSDTNDVRRAHDLLDELAARAELSQEQEKLLRSFLPERPNQKTLKEMNAQLKGDKTESAPELPTGMHIAEHEHYGPVVVSPGVGPDGRYKIFYLDPVIGAGTDLNEVEPGHLTFSDVEPAKPAHPEFLETEADYAASPDMQIIRTVEELEALDRDTVVISSENGEVYYAKSLTDIHVKSFLYVPAVVIASGAQVRAARESMELDNG